MAGLPFSGCESGRLREAPNGFPAAFGHVGDRQAGHRTFGFRTCPAVAGLRSAHCQPVDRGASASRSLGQDRASAGCCETADPGLRLRDRQAEPRLRPRILPDAEPRLRPPEPRGREAGRKSQICRAANRQGFGPVGEPAGKPEEASASDGPRRKRRFEPPVRAPPTRNRPARDASPPRPGSSNGTVGAGGDAGPH